jgi:hypothetical protein
VPSPESTYVCGELGRVVCGQSVVRILDGRVMLGVRVPNLVHMQRIRSLTWSVRASSGQFLHAKYNLCMLRNPQTVMASRTFWPDQLVPNIVQEIKGKQGKPFSWQTYVTALGRSPGCLR